MYEYKAKVLRVVDGDTMDLDIDLGFDVHTKQRVRLADIDTPETYGVKKDSEEYKAGMLAKERVEELIGPDGDVIINTIKDKKGKYGRILAIIYPLGVEDSVNDILLQEGLAEEYK